jgi:hypothetical protein
MADYANRSSTDDSSHGAAVADGASPGKHTLVEKEYARIAGIQRSMGTPADAAVIQRKERRGDAETGAAPAPTHDDATGMAGPVLDKMSRSFGTDLSGVRVHENSAAAVSMNARAYTQGSNIHFAPGQYDPTSQPGQELIGHELAHVVQQSSGRVAGGQAKGNGVAINGDVGLEREADEMGARVARGEVVGSAGAVAASDIGAIQRKTTIADDSTDPQNTTAKGTGKGLLKNSLGNIQPGVTFGPLINDSASSMEAWINPNEYDPNGTEPKAGTWPSWWAAAAPKPNNFWVRGHLLNHNLGGPGEKRNLTPITKAANSEHHNQIEKLLKLTAAEGGRMIDYKVVPRYGSTGPTGLVGDANDPDKSVWPKLTLGFDCEYVIYIDENTHKNINYFVENKR